MKIKLLFISLIFIAFSCASVEKSIKKGRYEQAIDMAVSKLKGTSKKSPKDVLGLETAFKYFTQSNLDKIESWKIVKSGENDLKILRAYEDIERVQSKINPLLPLLDKNGYRADINLIPVAQELGKYKDRAADYLYDYAVENLALARKGDKMAARKAYEQLTEMEGIVGGTTQSRQLVAEAKDLGVTYILFKPVIGPMVSLNSILTTHFKDFGELNNLWQQVDVSPERARFYDYEIEATFLDFKISPEKESTREYTDTKTIEEDTGKKDRNDKAIKEKIEVKADVKELYQFKEALVYGRVVITELKSKKILVSKNMDYGQRFENYASTYKGDRRALSAESLKRVGGRPLPFPTNDQILGDALNNLKNDMKNLILKEYVNY